ncbi:hypothetical protein, partial [Pseudobutyrivibrio sp.]
SIRLQPFLFLFFKIFFRLPCCRTVKPNYNVTISYSTPSIGIRQAIYTYFFKKVKNTAFLLLKGKRKVCFIWLYRFPSIKGKKPNPIPAEPIPAGGGENIKSKLVCLCK